MGRSIGNFLGMIVLLVPMLCLAAGSTEALSEAMGATPSCRRKCGDVDIPYPFGLNDDDIRCSRMLPLKFNLTCNATFSPPKVFRGDFEVMSISLIDAKVRFLLEVSSECYNATGSRISRKTWNNSLSRTFTFSHSDNVFTGVGCATVARIDGPSFTSGCISGCDNSSSLGEGECSGIGCCQTTVPKGLQRYSAAFGRFNNRKGIADFNPCSYSFLVEKGNYSFSKSDLLSMSTDRSFPVVVDWVVGEQSCTEAQTNRTSYGCVSKNSTCVDSVAKKGYFCNCSHGFSGNPYVSGGCKDINECENPATYDCYGICSNTVGSYTCQCPTGTDGNPRELDGCKPVRNKKTDPFPTATVVPVLVVSSILILVMSIWLHSLLQRRKQNKMKERWFLQNGGDMLQRRIALGGKNDETFKVFSKEEIEKATNRFDQSLVLGRGGQGVVYKGKLPNDSRTFAIKKSAVLDGSKTNEFINELIILSKINHRNIVKLVGCCLEDEQPFLVYEFIENGTLSEYIKSGSLTWESRLKISVEAASAFAYLHSSIEIPIIHGDVKSSNILLDKQLSAKVSDFGTSRLIPVDEIQVQTIVMGTLGYLDPEYLHTHMLTEKSDVYSFGVVLVELLTGMTALSYERDEAQRCLAMYFMSCMRANSLDQILDMRNYDANAIEQMNEVASLAKRCLNIVGENRPSMKEVAMELEGLRRYTSSSWVHGIDEELQCLLTEPHIEAHTKVLTKYYYSEATTSSNIEESQGAIHIESGR